MESITIKVDESMAEAIETAMKPYYGTKTEFIREAIRDKLKEISKEDIMKHFEKYFGKAKSRLSDKRLHEIRDGLAGAYAKKFGIRSD